MSFHMFRACVWMQGWAVQGTKWASTDAAQVPSHILEELSSNVNNFGLLGGSVHVDARSRAMMCVPTTVVQTFVRLRLAKHLR